MRRRHQHQHQSKFKFKRGKKREKPGTAGNLITRNAAARKLGLSIQDMNRLCILKGVFPRYPNEQAKKMIKHSLSKTKLFYNRKDINYIGSDPNIWTVREQRAFRKKIRSLKGQREFYRAEFAKVFHEPQLNLDHVVRERYPTFRAALGDLDDCLTACFLYANLPHLKDCANKDLIMACRRVVTEFMLAVIETRALRKAFVSIKGYFYQVELYGKLITWMVPHPFPLNVPFIAQARIIGNFCRFYVIMLSFVNYRLFHGMNMHYPPLPEKHLKNEKRPFATSLKEELDSRLEALAIVNLRKVVEPSVHPFAADAAKGKSRITADDEQGGDEASGLQQQDDEDDDAQEVCEGSRRPASSLFVGLYFFLNRECNLESLTLLIRACGGKISWPPTSGSGYTFSEDDVRIRYHIVDRNDVPTDYLNRYYVQPQWVYDSLNAQTLLPASAYLVGATLPAHLSPFEEQEALLKAEEGEEGYTPPEALRLRALQKKIVLRGDADDAMPLYDQQEDEEEQIDEGGDGEAIEMGERKANDDDEEEEPKDKSEATEKLKAKLKVDIDAHHPQSKTDKAKPKETKSRLAKMAVRRGAAPVDNTQQRLDDDAKEEVSLASRLVNARNRYKYLKLQRKEKGTSARVRGLKQRRMLYEDAMREGRTRRRQSAVQSGATGGNKQ